MLKDIYSKLFIFLRSSRFGQKIKKSIRKNALLRPVYNIYVQRLIDYRYPLTFNIEPTNACNLNCIMCPRSKTTRKVGFMEFSLFEKIIEESKFFGTRHFVLHKDGEPLMHPQIIEMVRLIKKTNSANTVYISTNGQLLDPQKSAALIEAGLDQLHISVGAASEQTYKKIRGGDFKNLEDNIISAILAKKRKKLNRPVVTLQIIRMEETLGEIETFVNKWKNYDVELSLPSYLTWGGAKHDSTLNTQKTIKRYPCHALWLSPSINWDGGVSICCVDWNAEELLGDIKDSSLAKIWQSEKIGLYRQYHLNSQYAKIPICANCNYWKETPNFWFSRQYKNR